jgi:hypothetical protein
MDNPSDCFVGEQLLVARHESVVFVVLMLKFGNTANVNWQMVSGK